MKHVSPTPIAFVVALLLVAWAPPGLRAQNAFIIEDTAADIGEVDLEVPIVMDSTEERHALSFSIRYDKDLLELKEIRLEDTAAAGALTTGASFGEILQEAGEVNWTIVMGLSLGDPPDFSTTPAIPAGNGQAVAILVFDVLATEEGTAAVALEDDLASFLPIETKNLMSTAGSRVEPDLSQASATITIQPGVQEGGFLRGDVDGNGILEITDVVNDLEFQFLGTYTPTCLDAHDFDDNGLNEITDGVNSLGHQFLGDPPPPPPGTQTCGEDPTDDALDCEAYPQERCN